MKNAYLFSIAQCFHIILAENFMVQKWLKLMKTF